MAFWASLRLKKYKNPFNFFLVLWYNIKKGCLGNARRAVLVYEDWEMSAEEFYNKVKADAGLQAALEKATDSGTVADFLSANGCTASADEFASYVAEHS